MGRGIADDDVTAARGDRRAFAEHDIAVAGDRIASLITEQRIIRPARDGVTGLVAKDGVVGGGGRDRRQSRVADRHVVTAGQGIGAGAGHRQVADGDVLGAARDIQTSVIAHRRVRAAGRRVERIITNRRAFRAARI